MTENEMADLPFAVVHRPGHEPQVMMPLSSWLVVAALARKAAQRVRGSDPIEEAVKALTAHRDGRKDLEILGHKKIKHLVRNILAQSDFDSVFLRIERSAETLKDNLVIFEAPVPPASSELEDAADRIALEAARARNEDVVPHELVKRLIAGDHPMKVYREYRGLTQAELAERVGLSKIYVSQIETGKRNGSTKTLKRIAHALGVGLDDLMSWNEVPDGPSKHEPSRRVLDL